MNRKYLVDTLEIVKPALATDNTIPIFQCFCFTEGKVSAYNDIIGIVGPTEVEADCGVHGNTLLGLLDNSSAEEVEFDYEKDLKLKLGKSAINLPAYGGSDFIFREPTINGGSRLQLCQSFMEGIELCLETTSSDETQPKLHGITLTKDRLYSCNGDTITRVSVKAPIKGQVLLPTQFCESLVKIWSNLTMTKGELVITDEWVCALFAEWSLYGRLKEIPDPIDFENLIKQTVKEKIELVPVPSNLNEALSRARVLADPESGRTEITIGKSKMTLFTSTHMGDVDDVLVFKGHPDVKASVSAAHIQKAIKVCDKMAFHENCVVLEKAPDVLLLVSNMH